MNHMTRKNVVGRRNLCLPGGLPQGFLETEMVTYLSCTMEFAPVALSSSILLYSLRCLSIPSSAIGIMIRDFEMLYIIR